MTMLFARCGVVLAILAMTACATVPDSYSPAAPAIPPQAFSHQDFDAVLRDHVADGVVDYPAVVGDPRLAAYLDQLNRVDPDHLTGRRDRLAFWINAYNALAIQGIVNGTTPLTWGGKYRYFVGDKYRVGGGELNLYGLEHKILIPLGEPRVHFAIVCASRSCPPLRSEVYTAAALDAQLDDQARRFINDPERNRFDRDNRVAHLSRIFKWYRDEFEGQEPLAFYVARYVADPQLAEELRGGGYRVEFLDYDWRTNGPLPDAG